MSELKAAIGKLKFVVEVQPANMNIIEKARATDNITTAANGVLDAWNRRTETNEALTEEKLFALEPHTPFYYVDNTHEEDTEECTNDGWWMVSVDKDSGYRMLNNGYEILEYWDILDYGKAYLHKPEGSEGER